eukprot:TRINITY_DN1866_c0_g2_i1.p1 TRINITY_DN1866_c0_g2~~TRINITY_DN1866_c0_g2_i1.p1  ORF type:complete len:288 (-),score=56.06 TRINITY_DN1866_c0_g2_i1:47-910(-)
MEIRRRTRKERPKSAGFDSNIIQKAENAMKQEQIQRRFDEKYNIGITPRVTFAKGDGDGLSKYRIAGVSTNPEDILTEPAPRARRESISLSPPARLRKLRTSDNPSVQFLKEFSNFEQPKYAPIEELKVPSSHHKSLSIDMTSHQEKRRSVSSSRKKSSSSAAKKEKRAERKAKSKLSQVDTLLMQPSAPMINIEMVEEVTEKEISKSVSEILAGLKLQKYIELFEREEIDWDSFLLLSDDDMKGMGLPTGPRTKIRNKIKNYKAKMGRKKKPKKKRSHSKKKRSQD